MKNYYQILGVPSHATHYEIKKAYRHLASQYHPDKNVQGTDHTLFYEVNEAYQILGDPLKRASYDYYHRLHQYTFETSTYTPPVAETNTQPYAARRTSENTVEQIRPYLKYAHWISRASFVFTLLIFLDFFLPQKVSQEQIQFFVLNQGVEQPGDFILITNQQQKVSLSTDFTRYYAPYPWVNIYRTRIFSHIARIERADRPNIQAEPYYSIYSTFIFMPMILLIISTIGTFIKGYPELNFNCGVVCVVLSLITAYLLFFS